MGRPDVSVVIATRNRETRLRFTLEALAEQTLDRERLEVIVVRAADTDGPLTEAPPGLEVRFLSRPPGPAAQRNAGWRAARADLVAFTDDDCRPAPDWLAALLAAGDGGEAILQGRTEPDPDEVHLHHGLARTIEITAPSGWFQTCNVAYPRALLERTGGFDESFPTAWAEDADLGLRALAEGVEHCFVDDALTYHAVHARTLPTAVREAWRRDSVPMLVARHPEARRLLHLGVFVHPHGSFLLALAGLLLIRRSPPVGALATMPYVLNRRRTIRPMATTLPKAIIRSPAKALVDAASLLTVLRAAARHRVLVI